MAGAVSSISGTNLPYGVQSYAPESNDKNTLTITDYFKLLATQLQNQDMSNPMDNSEMMAQMTQMAMVQSLESMINSIEASTATTTQTYAASLIGQEVTIMVTEENSFGKETPTGVKYGKVEYVSFVNGVPKFKIEGEDKDYTMSYLVGVGKVKDPFKEEDGEEGGSGDTVQGKEEPAEA